MSRRRNRRKTRPGVRLPPSFIGGVVLVSAVALAYLALHNCCEATGARIGQLEREREALKNEILNEQYTWSMLTSAKSINRLLQQRGLAMTWPEERQIVRLRLRPETDVNALLAQRSARRDVAHD